MPCTDAFAQGTAFTYQGQLQNNSSPASGTYNFQFSLYTNITNGTAVAGPVTNNAVTVTNGLFITAIDFGPGVFIGASNWLQIAVETNGAVSFSSLSPRQVVTPAPYAIFAEQANQVSGLYASNSLNNVFVGPSAGDPGGDGGALNTAVGNGALANNTSGFYNTANGYEALYSNIGGYYNTAYGVIALYKNTYGSANVANGYGSLYNNTMGQFNTANGYLALFSNTNGSDNTANGVQALYSNTSGNENTANGEGGLFSNTSGSQNTADGFQALDQNLSGSNNIALGYFAGDSITTGSSNIDIGNPGVSADSSIIRIGTSQTVTYLAGILNLSTPEITSGGTILLYSSNNFGNFFAGSSAGNGASDNGSENTAVGFDVLWVNTNGEGNTACGYTALEENTSGNNNTAEGVQALLHNKSGHNNTAVGSFALIDIGGGVTGGTNNIALGYAAGSAFLNNESSNIDIGNFGVPGESKIIRIGTPGIQTATYLSGTVYANGVALTSDRNAKEHFTSIDSQAVLAKVATLPVTEWNYKDEKSAQHIGPMAQDFHAAFGLDGADDKHISVVDEGGVALAAIQGLNEKLEAQSAENARLKQENNLLAKRLDELETEVKALVEKKQ